MEDSCDMIYLKKHICNIFVNFSVMWYKCKHSLISKKGLLTLVLHPDWLWFLTWFTDPDSVTGPDPEAVVSLRLQAWAHPEWGALTLSAELSPVAVLTNLHHVPCHSTATIVRRTRPGQHQRERGENAGHRTRSRRLGPICTKHMQTRTLCTCKRV